MDSNSLNNRFNTHERTATIQDSRESGQDYSSPQVIVLDMDGTIYDLESYEGEKGFKGSLLKQRVISNAIELVRNEDYNSRPEDIIKLAEEDRVGISSYLEKAYGIPRDEYFNRVWNINPEGVINPPEQLNSVLAGLSMTPNKPKIILLTAAPSIWMKRTIEYLDIGECFDRQISGSEFKVKEDVFSELAYEFAGSKVLSLGDQYQTDIYPALNLGLMAIKAMNSRDTVRLLGEICTET